MGNGINVRQVELVEIAALVPYARNARVHSERQVEQICASIKEFGWTNPVLIDEQGGIIAGHGRVLGAQRLKMATVPCIRLAGLTEAQRRALVLADNQLALNASWDEKMLAAEIRSLEGLGFDLCLTGFSDEQLDGLLQSSGRRDEGKDPDDPPAPPAVPVSIVGDVFILGSHGHRLICGDCCDPDVMAALVAGRQVDAVWTDPPYNVAYGDKAEFLNNGGAGKGHRITSKILNDDMSDEAFRSFLLAFYQSVFSVMKPGAAIYVAHSETERANFTSTFLAAGFKLSSNIIWRKDCLVLGRSDYQWIHEPILYGWKEGKAHRWYGGRKKTTIVEQETPDFIQRPDGKWQIQIGTRILIVEGDAMIEEMFPSVVHEPKPRRSDLHPTMKPVALIEKLLRNSTRPGDTVLDPFGGSGSTMMAAERLGLTAYLAELAPTYVDVIVARWEEYTGRKAVHEATGKTLEQLRHERTRIAA